MFHHQYASQPLFYVLILNDSIFSHCFISTYMLITFNLVQTSLLCFRYMFNYLWSTYTLMFHLYFKSACLKLNWFYLTQSCKVTGFPVFMNSTANHKMAKPQTLQARIILDSFLSLTIAFTFFYFLVLFPSPIPVLLPHFLFYHSL